MTSLHAPSVESIYSAHERLAGTILRTPLIRFDTRSNDFSRSEATKVATTEIYLKLENLQPTGSFKVRGAGNALLSANPDQLKKRRVDSVRWEHGAGAGVVREKN